MTWVLLRGLARESKHWGEFLPLFTHAVRPAEVCAIDLPGTGVHHRTPSPWTMDQILAAVRAELELKGIKPPYRLLAISLGGMVALHWAQAYPAEIDCFVIANTSDRHSLPPSRLRAAIWPQFFRAVRNSDPLARERQILKIISNVPEQIEARAHEWATIAEEQPMSRLAALAQITAASRFRAAETIKPRGLFLCSLGDRLVDPSCTLRLSQILARPVLTHPWAGHDLTLDDPQWVTQSVREFLKS
jgi:pimeloyl-ACP methyl ester carboxylesterase